MSNTYKWSYYDTADKFYADVKFLEHNNAKRLGAKWDLDLKKWYFTNSRDRHDWDMRHSNYHSKESIELNQYLKLRDIYDTIHFLYCSANFDDYHPYVYSSYDNLVNYLLKKYGPVKFDYFDADYNVQFKLNSKTQLGLEIHHIDETKYFQLSHPKYAKQSPFSCQKADRLVYCNKIEHLLLHLLISEQYMNHMNGKYYTYGPKTLIERNNDLFIAKSMYGNNPFNKSTENWKNDLLRAISSSYTEYIVLLYYIYGLLVSKYNYNADIAFDLVTSIRDSSNNIKIYKDFMKISRILNKNIDVESRLVEKLLIRAI